MKKPLVAKDLMAQTSITRDKLEKLQQEDSTLEKYVDMKDAVRKGDYEIKFEKHRGILFRIQNPVDGLSECLKQIMVSKTLRRKWKFPTTPFLEDISGSRRLKTAFKQISTGLACKVMVLVSADLVMYVRRRLLKDLFPVCH